MSDAFSAFSNELAELVARAGQSVVAVASGRTRLSGVALDQNLVVTADEGLPEEGDIIVYLAGGEHRPAAVVGRDASTDVVLLRIEGAAAPAVSFDPAAGIRAGALALSIGSLEGAPLAAFGVVAHSGPAWRSLRGGDIDARIELDLRMRRQAEGGLVVDAAGRALGMAVFGPRRRALVIPGSTILRVRTEIGTHGRIRRGYLGLGLQPVRLDGGEGLGLIAISVDKDGPAAQAGFAQGDVLTGWNGKGLPGLRELQRSLGAQAVGTRVRLAFRRGGSAREAEVTIGERPAA